jgi:hypothetical protein
MKTISNLIKKKNLRTGMRITNRSGDQGIVFMQCIKLCDGWIHFSPDGIFETLEHYTDDLQMIGDGLSSLDIIKIESPLCWLTEWEID